MFINKHCVAHKRFFSFNLVLQVKGFVQLSNVCYVGSHVMDIMVPPRPLKPCDDMNHITTMDKKVSEVAEMQAVSSEY